MSISLEVHFKRLNVTKYSSIEEIKHSYKALAKACHPDLIGGDGSSFKDLNASFHWLADNHKNYHVPSPKPQRPGPAKPKPTHDHIYRVLLSNQQEQKVMMPFKTIEKDTILHIMFKDEEYSLLLKKSESLPKTFYNADLPLKIVVEFDDFFGY